MAGVNSVFSFKVLAAITVAVLGAHLAALQASPMALRPSQAEPPLRAFITRSIEPVAPPMAVPAGTHTAQTESPPPRQRARPSCKPVSATARLAGGARPGASSHADARPPREDWTAVSSQAQDAAAQAPPDTGAEQLALAPGTPPPPRDSALAAAADKLPGSVRLKYQVLANKFPYRLNAELLWQQTGDQYAARLEISAFGQARVQTSRGQITPAGSGAAALFRQVPQRGRRPLRSGARQSHIQRQHAGRGAAGRRPGPPERAGATRRHARQCPAELPARQHDHDSDHRPARCRSLALYRGRRRKHSPCRVARKPP